MVGGEYSLLVVTSDDMNHPTKVTVKAFSLSELYSELQSILLLPEGMNNNWMTRYVGFTVSLLDIQFNEYVQIHSLEEIPKKAKLRVEYDLHSLRTTFHKSDEDTKPLSPQLAF